jgi:hypothetical protein
VNRDYSKASIVTAERIVFNVKGDGESSSLRTARQMRPYDFIDCDFKERRDTSQDLPRTLQERF